MEFCLNYSDPAAELYQQGAIHADRFKCAEFPEMIATARKITPIYVHFPLVVGTEKTDWNLDAIAAMRDGTHTPQVNVHLAPREEEYLPLGDSGDTVLFERTLAQLDTLKKRFGQENVMLESVMYRDLKGAFYRGAVDPKNIAMLVRQADVGFLFDVSHARLAAQQTGVLEDEYIRQLPLERLRELHITGLGEAQGMLLDHMPLTEPDWKWTQYVLDRIASGQWPKPWCAALEYGGTGPHFLWRTDVKVIREQVPRLEAMVKKAAGG